MYMRGSVRVGGQRKGTRTGRKGRRPERNRRAERHARERNGRREDALETRERVDEVVERSEQIVCAHKSVTAYRKEDGWMDTLVVGTSVCFRCCKLAMYELCNTTVNTPRLKDTREDGEGAPSTS
jgi:hypothetical protein